MGDLIIGGTRFTIEAPTRTWHQSGWNAMSEICIPVAGHPQSYGCTVAYGERAKNRRPRRYSTRPRLRQFGLNPTYEATKSVINKFVLHHDGCLDAKMCWNVLHNERGLSAHFIIDNDGMIFQTLDLGLMGYHAKEFNPTSIGVEFCNRGDAIEFPNYYEKRGVKGRDNRIKTCKINGHTIRSYDFTQAQYDSFLSLARDLTRLLPNIAVEFPQEPGSPGQQSWGTIDFGGAMGYSGYIGHYHLTNQKWDPGPFDIKEFCRKLRGQFCFPMFTKDPPKNDPNPRPYIPKQIDELRDISNELYAMNEERADGGFFPVGPWGEQRLWHGGIHLTGKEGAPLYAPFPGRVVALRMGAEGVVGSNNFILLRHDLSLGDVPVKFWSLYMHLADELGTGAKPPDWFAKLKTAPKPGEVTLLDEPIEASSPIGRIGQAGPDVLRRPQLHLEFFSIEPLFDKVAGSTWELVDGTSGGRFCDADTITKLIDKDADGKLTKQELSSFYRGGGGQQFRQLMTYHVSEWTFEPDWKDALRSTADFRSMKPAELDRMIDEQIVPGLWWNDDVAAHAGLPSGGEVVHYHPVKFVHWFNEKLLDAAAAAPTTPLDESKAAKASDAGLTDDFGDVEGEHAMSDSEEEDDRCDKLIEKKDMVQGFDAPPKPGCPQ
jgi:hypothetical protein